MFFVHRMDKSDQKWNILFRYSLWDFHRCVSLVNRVDRKRSAGLLRNYNSEKLKVNIETRYFISDPSYPSYKRKTTRERSTKRQVLALNLIMDFRGVSADLSTAWKRLHKPKSSLLLYFVYKIPDLPPHRGWLTGRKFAASGPLTINSTTNQSTKSNSFISDDFQHIERSCGTLKGR